MKTQPIRTISVVASLSIVAVASSSLTAACGSGDDAAPAATSAGGAGAWVSEEFVSIDRVPSLDATGAVRTSFDGWYDHNQATNGVSPRPGAWLVHGGGAAYKVEILGTHSNPDATVGMTGGRYLLRVGAL